jgi:PTS system galactitol-specific IIC component
VIALPAIVVILGIALGQKWDRAIRSGLLAVIGVVGIFLTLGLLGQTVSDLGTAFAARTGLPLDIIDIGWPVACALAFSLPIGGAIIPIGIGLNLALIHFGLTRTVDIDIWNFWHMAFVGALVQSASGSLALGLVAASLSFVAALFLADWSAPLVQKHFALPGISIPHLQSAGYLLLAVPFAPLLNRIPLPSRPLLFPDTVRRRLGFLGEPMMLGAILGALLALLAGRDLLGALKVAVGVAATMVLSTRTASVLMEGISPLTELVRKFGARHAKSRPVCIGLDSAVLIGNPSVIATGLLLVPVQIVLAALLAGVGNRTLPFIDLADGPAVAAMLVPLVAGDVLLALILATVVMGVGLLFATALAPTITQMIASSPAGALVPASQAGYTVLTDSAVPVTYGLFYIFKMPAPLSVLAGVAALIALYLVKEHFPLGDSSGPESGGESTTAQPS